MSRAPRPIDHLRATGIRLKAARLALQPPFGLKAAEFSKAIGVQPNTYSQWENGARLLDVLVAIRISERFGITLEWLYRGNAAQLPNAIFNDVLAHAADLEKKR
jgi:transcriptional regulator with XRE-family HTH domain